MKTKKSSKKPRVAILEITHCKKCPFFREERHYTSDSFEHAYNWFCQKSKLKKIAGYVEWHEESKIQIPDWCPLSK